MTQLDLKKLLLGTSVLAGFAAMSIAAPAYAQTADDEPVSVQPVAENEDDDGDEVVVTGSRLKKSTFNSTTPLQVITTEEANVEGLFSPTEILQTNSSAAGTQIDSTFQGFVLDNGPGSETIDLRGLGASRTLVLLNGRRMAPAGVEGAPTQPSINLIPATMIDRFDILLDGASSVYGSDAVAGVVNAIIRNDYDGLELRVDADRPEQGDGAGSDYTIGARYGINGDRGFIGGAIEHRYQDPYTANDRDFLSGCETYREITEDGEIRTVDLSDQFVARGVGLDAPTSPCRATRLTQRFIAGNFGSIYYQPDVNNTGIAGFSESTLFGVPIDGDGDGIVDINFFERSPNAQELDVAQIVNEQSITSLFVNGEYTFEGEMNITPFFEALHSDLDFKGVSQQAQLFPFVPANNPFNPCNTLAGGVDCNQAYNNLLLSPNYQQAFQAYYNNPELGSANCFGLGNTAACNPANFGLLLGPAPQLIARPVVGVRGDRNVTEVELAQTRLTAGVRGDLPGINFGTLNDFDFEVAAVYSHSDGDSARSGIRGDRLDLSLGFDPVSGAQLSGPCAQNADGSISPLLIQGCVPVNLFAPSLYNVAAGGDFATQAERDYLFDSRDFATSYSQLLIDGFVRGDLYSLPGGEVTALAGFQIREDVLDSRPDDVARDGLFFGFFADGGAAGDRTTQELYGEVSVPLGTGNLGLRELNVDLAGRITDDEFYGTNSTYSVKAGYRPVDSLLLRTTFGTSYRAPNLRELFLRGQSGFNTIGDPCSTPEDAFNRLTNTYIAANDTRSQVTLDNCIAAGIDPTNFLIGNPGTSVEINTGGSLDLDPETSESFTAGFAFDQPFTDKFELEFGATYYDIEITDTIIETGAGFLVNQCYNVTPGFESPFCGRVTRDFGDLSDPGRLDIINAGFVNRDTETAEGVDYNVSFRKDNVSLFGKAIDFSGDAQINQKLERLTVDQDDNGVTTEEDFVGDFGFSEWSGRVRYGASFDRWSAVMTSRFIGEAETDEEERAVTDFTNFIDGSTVTCGGPTQGDVNCRPVFFAEDYWVHSASLRYRGDDWDALVGVSNLFNDEPPLVSPREVFAVNNVPIGNGYDFDGREFFIRLRKTFR